MIGCDSFMPSRTVLCPVARLEVVMQIRQKFHRQFRGLVAEVPWAVWGLAGALALLTLARPVHGQVWVDVNDLNGKLPDWVDPKYVNAPPARPEVAPPPPEERPGLVRVWVEPVYRTVVVRRVWVDGGTRVVYDRVWVPPRYEYRDVVTWEGGRQVIRRELVVVEQGHYETRAHEVFTPGHWEDVTERVLVAPGHWEWVPRPMPVPMPMWR
jgi:hypothetical protein